MKARTTIPLLALSIAAACVATPAAAQAQSGNSNWVAPRTPEGQPDLQGNWTNATVTPFERPSGVGPVMSAEEVAAIREAAETRAQSLTRPSDPNRPAPPVGGDGSTGAAGGVGGYDGIYIDRGDAVAVVRGEARTSLVTFPADGRVPATTEASRAERLEYGRSSRAGGAYDHPENRPLGERCIMSFGSNAGPPMLPNGFYNNNYTIVQTADHVVIMTEMIHDTRIIRIGDGPRLPPDVRPWMGDSWGRWEGDTLVVETTNLHPMQRFRSNSSDNLKVIERFTREDEDTIVYHFTIDDPSVYAEPWGGEVPLESMGNELIYEYACHEGNYALSNILSGARYQERQAAQNQSEPR
ncbi:MAG: hypothetical protein WEG36_04490 [Gemmatimonadota bacterium]